MKICYDVIIIAMLYYAMLHYIYIYVIYVIIHSRLFTPSLQLCLGSMMSASNLWKSSYHSPEQKSSTDSMTPFLFLDASLTFPPLHFWTPN